MTGGPLRAVPDADPVRRLWSELPAAWRGPVIGPGIAEWPRLTENGNRTLNLRGLPGPFPAELAWMAHWQAMDGTRCSVLAISQLANMLRRAQRDGHPFPPSMRQMDLAAALALQGWFYAHRWGRLPPTHARRRLGPVFRFARTALLARCSPDPWWSLDEWHPRCDPRIPITDREPQANYGCSPGLISTSWLREATKWHLGTQLQAGTLRWTTVSLERLPCLRRFDRWLAETFTDPADVLTDSTRAGYHAAGFRAWTAQNPNRKLRAADTRTWTAPVSPRLVNDDLRAVAELLAFMAANKDDAPPTMRATPWDLVSDAHAAGWYRQVTRIPHTRHLDDRHYIDDHAMAQIPAALPLIGLPRDQQMTISRGDGTTITAHGLDDPQAMRMILLQILTGRRASEIRNCRHDCLSPVPNRGQDQPDVVRFHYAQSKIDTACDHILIDPDTAAIITEQQAWIAATQPGLAPRHLFLRRTGNRRGDKPYPQGTYGWVLRQFSQIAAITDGQGRPVTLSHTHRFRHSKLTRLAELGLPIHVLQRYAGHATPTMTMHYVAARHEHAEQAFLATTKFRADGSTVTYSHDDLDILHLFDRADRILPNGSCLLPPLQTCDKGNACLTCSAFVTDPSHDPALTRQLHCTQELITTHTTAFQQAHGTPMPEDNIWLTQRRAEQAALTRLLAAMAEHPGRPVRGTCQATTPATTKSQP